MKANGVQGIAKVSKYTKLFAAGLGFLLPLMGISAGRADVILSNLEATPTGPAYNIQGSSFLALGFTVGSSNLVFDNGLAVTALLRNAFSASDLVLSGGIYSDTAGSPGSLLYSFGPETLSTASTSELTLQTSTAVTLQANTTYWIDLERPTAGFAAGWELVNAAPTGSSASFVGELYSNDSGSSWTGQSTSSGFFGVSIAEAPEPATWALLGLGLCGILFFRRRPVRL